MPLPLVERGGGGAVEHAARDDVGLDVGERELDRLQVEQHPAERGALTGVVDGNRERLGREADGDRGDVDARDVDRPERRAHALAGGREQRVRRHVHLVVGDLADRQERARPPCRRAARRCTPSLRASTASIRTSPVPRSVPVRHTSTNTSASPASETQALRPVTRQPSVDRHGARRDRRGVGARVRLRQREAAEQLAAHEPGREALAQLGLPEAGDRVGHRVVHRERERVGGIAAAELLEDVHRVCQRGTLPADLRGREEAEQAVAGGRGGGVARECRGAPPSRAPAA